MIGTCIADEKLKIAAELADCERALRTLTAPPAHVYRAIARFNNRQQIIRRLTEFADDQKVAIELDFVCRTCPRFHRETVTPASFAGAIMKWKLKHPRCETEFVESPRRIIPRGYDDRRFEQLGKAPWYLTYRPNADIKTAYAASANLTLSANSFAASAALVAGRESTAISNSANLYLDAGILCNGTAGATGAQVGLFQFWAYASIADTPAYPVNHTGSDSTVTHTPETRNAGLNFFGDIVTAATANKQYTLRPRSLGEVFGWIMPQEWGFWYVHTANSSTNTSNAANNTVTYLPIYATG